MLFKKNQVKNKLMSPTVNFMSSLKKKNINSIEKLKRFYFYLFEKNFKVEEIKYKKKDRRLHCTWEDLESFLSLKRNSNTQLRLHFPKGTNMTVYLLNPQKFEEKEFYYKKNGSELKVNKHNMLEFLIECDFTIIKTSNNNLYIYHKYDPRTWNTLKNKGHYFLHTPPGVDILGTFIATKMYCPTLNQFEIIHISSKWEQDSDKKKFIVFTDKNLYHYVCGHLDE